MFRRKPVDPALPETPDSARDSRAHNERMAQLEALKWKDAPPEALADALRFEAQRLYAPANTSLFPARFEFNQIAGMAIALCDVVNPRPQEDPNA